MDRPVHARRVVLYDSKGNRYIAEHAGAWDPPSLTEWPEKTGDGRSGCYYEDDHLPKGAISLYRLTKVAENAANVHT